VPHKLTKIIDLVLSTLMVIPPLGFVILATGDSALSAYQDTTAWLKQTCDETDP
jgi:hypothetical protein